MKKVERRLTVLALVLALAVGMTGQTALASQALGTELVGRTTPLAEGVSWTNQRLWSASKSDLRTENYITYFPSMGVTPVIYSGEYVASRSTVSDAAAALEEQGYRVIAGINGGFFNGDGTIVGMLMTDGVVRSLDVNNYSMLGFTRDGRVFIDESRMTKTVSWGMWFDPVQHGLAGFNAYRSKDALGGLYLYNEDFASMVHRDAGRDCVAVVLTPWTNGWYFMNGAQEVTMNGALTLTVESVMDTGAGDTFDGTLTDGRYMLFANYYDGNDALLDALRSLTAGQQVTVEVSGVSEQWADAVCGVSGLYTLLKDGEIVPDLSATANPSTAVGLMADGTAVFYTIDGRQSGYSVGATYTQVAQRLQELGCVSAVALDGGGSTALGATLPGRQKFELLNRPSQANRPLNNFIFLVAKDGYARMDPGFYLHSDTQVVYVGASLNVSAAAYDQWGQAASGMTPVWSASGGTIEGDGLTAVYTAGNTAGTYAISAGSGSELPVRVVDALSSLWVTPEGSSAALSSLSLTPGDSVDLSAAGTWRNLPAAVAGCDLTWEADAAIGTIDGSGVFTAAGRSEAVSGHITVSAGGLSASVQVTVQAYPFTDIAEHWSAAYVNQLYKLGLTKGIEQADGTYIYNPSSKLTRGELIVLTAQMLHIDAGEYQDVELPFEDAGSIAGWMLPSVKALYALNIINGSAYDGKLYAGVGDVVSREEAMTMLGRVLAEQMSQDLSGFDDSGSVSSWARPYVETLVGLEVVKGSDGKLNPKSNITRGEAAKLLVDVNGLEKAELTLRPTDPEGGTPEPDDPDRPGEEPGDPDDPELPGEEPSDPDGPELPGEEPGDPDGPELPGEEPGDPDDPDLPKEGTGDPDSSDESSAGPLD